MPITHQAAPSPPRPATLAPPPRHQGHNAARRPARCGAPLRLIPILIKFECRAAQMEYLSLRAATNEYERFPPARPQI